MQQIIKNGRVHSIESFRALEPKAVFAGDYPSNRTLALYGWSILDIDTEPTPQAGEVVEKGPIEERSGQYYQTWIVRPETASDIAKQERRLSAVAANLVGRNPEVAAIAYLLADIWQAQNPGLSVAEARLAVRDRLKTHLRALMG